MQQDFCENQKINKSLFCLATEQPLCLALNTEPKTRYVQYMYSICTVLPRSGFYSPPSSSFASKSFKYYFLPDIWSPKYSNIFATHFDFFCCKFVVQNIFIIENNLKVNKKRIVSCMIKKLQAWLRYLVQRWSSVHVFHILFSTFLHVH